MASPGHTDDDIDEHKAWKVAASVMLTIALALVLPSACDLRAQELAKPGQAHPAKRMQREMLSDLIHRVYDRLEGGAR